jgi:hypothetical protein
MRRVVGDAVLTFGGAMLLVLTLVTFDERVRDQITNVLPALAAASPRSSPSSRRRCARRVSSMRRS